MDVNINRGEKSILFGPDFELGTRPFFNDVAKCLSCRSIENIRLT